MKHIKTRARKLMNGMWVVEVKRWHEFKWKGARVDRTLTTRGAAELGQFHLPRISIEPPGAVHYPLCWHNTEDAAKREERDLLALIGA